MRGISSLKNLPEGSVTKHSSNTTLDKKWGTRRITPAAIAMAAIYVSSPTWVSIDCGDEFPTGPICRI